MRLLVVLTVVALAGGTAAAHKPSDAHLRLSVAGDRVTGRIDVAVRDLDAAIGLDDGDGRVTWGELTGRQAAIREYVAGRLRFDACELELGEAGLVDLSDGAYWSMRVAARCEREVTALVVRYELLFDVDAQHRGLVHVDGQTLVVRDGAPVTARVGAETSAVSFVREGVWHIWIGLDHVLFLLCLLLPAVFPRRGPAQSLREVSVEVFEIVTAFTLAHSITLIISAVGLAALARWGRPQTSAHPPAATVRSRRHTALL